MTLDFFEKLKQNVERFPDRVVFQNLTETERETFTYRQVAEEAAAMVTSHEILSCMGRNRRLSPQGARNSSPAIPRRIIRKDKEVPSGRSNFRK